ncbi:sodium-driven chloride bicarbonate exchanger-like [Homalodisca vitripennis]|uniref:sodium-driven chloride bicarbonate exchanger-like n=1 Tax=Homalodisca vitripennis TaxID=197043 RepID=UPI001EEB8B8A|nr:sodium-driven chloride bicarbonate exchanger-like [Homalodisca vitripennis]
MDASSGDEEAPPRDPGVNKPQPKAFTAKDFEGHRAHTMYVGVHLPGEKRHRKHKHSRANSRDSDEDERPRQFTMGRRGRLASITDEGETFTPPAQRVQFILGEDADDNTHEIHPLFSEMEELFRDEDCLEWRETARWIKFEEDVEEGGNRWSKPHVATLSLHSLFELRSLLLNGSVVLDMEAVTLEQVSDLLLDHMCNTGALQEDTREKVSEHQR